MIINIFDYKDCVYNNEDPLNYLMRKELFDTIRKTYLKLTNFEQKIIEEILLKERSFTNTAILLNLSIEEIKHKYQLFLEVFYRIFQKEFYS